MIDARSMTCLHKDAGFGKAAAVTTCLRKLESVEWLVDRADASGGSLGGGGLLTAVIRAVLERAVDAEMTGHLGGARHDPAGGGPRAGNSRNGFRRSRWLPSVAQLRQGDVHHRSEVVRAERAARGSKACTSISPTGRTRNPPWTLAPTSERTYNAL